MRKHLLLVPLLLALAACSDTGNGGGSGSSSGGSGSSSSGGSSSSSGGTTSAALSPFVLNLFSMDTSDTALPTDLTTVMLDTSSEDPGAYTSLFAPGS